MFSCYFSKINLVVSKIIHNFANQHKKPKNNETTKNHTVNNQQRERSP